MAKKKQKERIVALDYQVIGESFWYDGKKLSRLADADKVRDWIRSLAPGNTVLTEFGGAADGPDLEIARRGLKLYCVPPTFEKQAREAFGISGRKRDAEVVFRMFQETAWQPYFYEHKPVSDDILKIAALYRTYTSLISSRVALQNSFTAVYRQAAWQSEDGSFGKLDDFIKRACADNTVFAEATAEEKSYLKQLEIAVEQSEFYQLALKPITGIGPRTAAGLIGITGTSLRFFDPKQPGSVKVAQNRFGEYAGLRGQAFIEQLLAARRKAGQHDVGVPGLKNEAFFIADQLNRQESPVLLWRKLKELHTILDELLNSPERTETVFGSANQPSLGPKTMAHKRALRKAKDVFVVGYFFPTMYSWETSQLPADFDAEKKWQELVGERIERDQKLIVRHQELRLARLPYKLGPHNGPTAFGDWLSVYPIELANISSAYLRYLALEQAIADVKEEMADIKAKLDGKKASMPNESRKHLQAALGRRNLALEALKAGNLPALKKQGRQLVWQTRGIGQPICELIEERVPVLRSKFLDWQARQQEAMDALQAQIQGLQAEKKAAQTAASSLNKALRQAEKKQDKARVAQIKEQIREANLPKVITGLQKQIDGLKSAMAQTKKDFKQELDKIFHSLRPDLSPVLDSDPRLQERSKRDRRFVEETIFAIIELRAKKGLWAD